MRLYNFNFFVLFQLNFVFLTVTKGIYEQPFTGYLFRRNINCVNGHRGILILDYAKKRAWCYAFVFKDRKLAEEFPEKTLPLKRYEKFKNSDVIEEYCRPGFPTKILTDMDRSFLGRFLLPYAKVVNSNISFSQIHSSLGMQNYFMYKNIKIPKQEFCVVLSGADSFSNVHCDKLNRLFVLCTIKLPFLETVKEFDAPIKDPDLTNSIRYKEKFNGLEKGDGEECYFIEYSLAPALCKKRNKKKRLKSKKLKLSKSRKYDNVIKNDNVDVNRKVRRESEQNTNSYNVWYSYSYGNDKFLRNSLIFITSGTVLCFMIIVIVHIWRRREVGQNVALYNPLVTVPLPPSLPYDIRPGSSQNLHYTQNVFRASSVGYAPGQSISSLHYNNGRPQTEDYQDIF